MTMGVDFGDLMREKDVKFFLEECESQCSRAKIRSPGITQGMALTSGHEFKVSPGSMAVLFSHHSAFLGCVQSKYRVEFT